MLVPTELPGRAEPIIAYRTVIDPAATPTGLEPATFAVTGRRANQLRYGAYLLELQQVVWPI